MFLLSNMFSFFLLFLRTKKVKKIYLKKKTSAENRSWFVYLCCQLLTVNMEVRHYTTMFRTLQKKENSCFKEENQIKRDGDIPAYFWMGPGASQI